jgi:kynurenine formamidase
MGEHTGTHFDAPIHWVSKDPPQLGRYDSRVSLHRAGLRDRYRPPGRQQSDYELTVADIEAWESRHGRIPARLGAAAHRRSKRKGRDYVNMAEDGPFARTVPGAVRWLVERDVHGFGRTIGTDSAGPTISARVPGALFARRAGTGCNAWPTSICAPSAAIVAAPLKIAKARAVRCGSQPGPAPPAA